MMESSAGRRRYEASVSGRGPTAWEVAREAGVTQSTVSLVLSGRAEGRVSVATQERVRQAAERLGYRPHAAARSLRSGRSGLVVLMVPQLQNPFFVRVMDGAEQAAFEYGYSVVLTSRRRDAIFAAAAAVDGIIACSQPLPKLDGSAGQAPAVILDYKASNGVPNIGMDVNGGHGCGGGASVGAGAHPDRLRPVGPAHPDLPRSRCRVPPRRRAVEHHGGLGGAVHRRGRAGGTANAGGAA